MFLHIGKCTCHTSFPIATPPAKRKSKRAAYTAKFYNGKNGIILRRPIQDTFLKSKSIQTLQTQGNTNDYFVQ